jgi:hypothetical protein
MASERKPRAPKRILQAALLLLSIGFYVGVQAQSSTVGSISGTVRDANGAGLKDTEVLIEQAEKGFSRTVETDGSGFYSAPRLPIGMYSITVAVTGFKKAVRDELELHVNDDLEINFDLTVGEVSEVMTVTGDEPIVNVRNGEVSSLISEKQVTELPLNGRNYAQLALMVPGVSPVTGTTNTFASRGTGLNAGVDMSVNGNSSNANLWTVDGVNNMDVGSNRTLLVFPSVDSIAEFKVERSSFSAEFGQAQGAVINLVTKGGGNEFHGTAFEFFRNDALNATNFFLNRAGQEKGKLRYNNFGFNFNGPIWKEKVFFFWSEEWRRERRGITIQGRVPTAAEKSGDFSGPLTGPAPHIPGQTGFYPGGRIPANLLSPAGLALLRIYPDPNVSDPSAPGANWFAAPLQPISTRQDLIRGDVVLNDKMNVMVRWIGEKWTHDRASGNFWGDSPFPTITSDWDQPSYSFAAKFTYAITPTAINEFQFSRAGNDILVTTSPESEALQQEISSVFPTVFPQEVAAVPSFFWGNQGYDNLWHQAPWDNQEDLMIWKDDFSKVAGQHSIKAGVLFSHNVKDETAGAASDLLVIQGGGAHTGNAIADLLIRDLPLVNYYERDHLEKTLGRWHDLEFYGNDTWKVHPRVTLNFGLRWSRYSPAYSDDNRISNYIVDLFDGVNPLSGLVQADQADAAGLPRSLVFPYNKGFQPRVGVAWDVFGDGKTSLRGGFGRFMARTQVIEDVLRMANNPPWTRTVDAGWGGSGETATLADCPTCRSLDTINPGLANAFAGATNTFSAVDPNFRPPESWQWNLTVSREVVSDTVLEVSYVGNLGDKIWRRQVQINDVNPAARQEIADLLRQGLGDAATAVTNANRRFVGLGNIPQTQSTGESNYHGLQVWLNRRFSNRLAYQASYTWGHSISNVPLTSYVTAISDPFNFEQDHGDADLDRRHTFVANAVYELPSFDGLGDIGSAVLGNWQLNTIFTALSGTPLDVVSGANTAGLAVAGALRPDLVPGVPIYLDNDSDPTTWLNPAAFALPAAGSFGNLGRGAIRAPKIINIDLSVNKNWSFGERYGIQFRAEFFNVFNHPNFIGLDTNLALENNITNANFGRSTNGVFGRLNATQAPREIQFGLKFSF